MFWNLQLKVPSARPRISGPKGKTVRVDGRQVTELSSLAGKSCRVLDNNLGQVTSELLMSYSEKRTQRSQREIPQDEETWAVSGFGDQHTTGDAKTSGELNTKTANCRPTVKSSIFQKLISARQAVLKAMSTPNFQVKSEGPEHLLALTEILQPGVTQEIFEAHAPSAFQVGEPGHAFVG